MEIFFEPENTSLHWKQIHDRHNAGDHSEVVICSTLLCNYFSAAFPPAAHLENLIVMLNPH